MNALFRHLTVRLWLSVLVGGWLCLYLLPWWQNIFGLNWLALPAALIFGVCFGLAGWAMSRIGVALAQRQVNEAAVWERAGMIREAENAFRRSAAFFDSFWLSPVSRRSQTRSLSGALARFYLSHFAGRPYTRAVVAAYLANFPQDEAVAESWLEGLLLREVCSSQEHEAVARVSGALSQNKPIQHLLLRFYLANGRIDFDAQQTYRRVWKEQQPLATDLVHALARLLRREAIVNPWALQVYIKAYQTGESESLEGIAAGLSLLPMGDECRSDLAVAEKLVSGLDADRVRQMALKFKPAADTQRPAREMVQPVPRQRVSPGRVTSRTVVGVRATLNKSVQRAVVFARTCFTSFHPRQAWYALGVASAGVVIALIVMLSRPASQSPVAEAPPAPPVEDKTVVSDPFTIQVAAYLKVQDAQRIVDQLTLNKLDAFWTKATSANRTWYQVKVSHFATREAAQQFGQELKSKGLIDDFYVANYEPR